MTKLFNITVLMRELDTAQGNMNYKPGFLFFFFRIYLFWRERTHEWWGRAEGEGENPKQTPC